MLAPVVSHMPLSKFAFCDWVLATTLELEKARTGRVAKSEPLRQLADALSKAASPVCQGEPTAFVEAGYFEPLERLFTSVNSQRANSIEQIQDFVQEATLNMRSLEVDSASKNSIPNLISFCVALHEELIRALESESGVSSMNPEHQTTWQRLASARHRVRAFL